jgi:WD40 repeat protein
MMCWLAGFSADALRTSAQGLPVKPILRIETGTHTGSIQNIDADAAERYLVSGSDDKTVRIWDLPSGKLLRVLRPPIGEGPGIVEGKDGVVYAVAISPDGRTIACGGLTGSIFEKMSIYLFERESGRLYRRIAGLPETIVYLRYSPDGRFLVACMGGKNGIRVYRTGDYAQVSEDLDYGGASTGADFAVATDVPNLLATSSYDGFLRLYEIRANGSLRLVTKRSAPGGARPSGVRFSPNGSRIAIGFSDAAQVNVLSPTDLSPICLPDTTDLNRSLNSVVWSADGSFLYAAGRHMLRPGANPIIRWGDGGCGPRVDLPGALTTISSLRSMRDGGIAFAAADPAIGIVNRQGEKRLFFGQPDSAEMLVPSKFLVSSNGMRVCLADQPAQGTFTCFSVADRILTSVVANREASTKPPLTEGLAVTDWEISPTPKLKGKVLRLFQNERSRCLAIAPNRQQFLLGTDWLLRLFDRTGVQKWVVPTPSTPGAVNISGDGRLAIAVFSNGTVHWYRIEDGKELFAVFIHQDWKRWVLWTPSGYYDASPGGEELIGWHINNGRDAAADFFPVSRFRATYYRPDIIERLMGALDEAEATRLADAELARRQKQESIAQILPPVVTIISPSDGETAAGSVVKVRYRLRAPSGQPVTAVRVLVDGRPVGTPQRLVPADDSSLGTVRRLTLEGVGGPEDEREIEVRIPERDCEFAVIAENRYSVSEPARVRLRWQGQTRSEIRPKLYVLAVGVSAYPPQYRLNYPAKDASDFVHALGTQQGRLYRDIQVQLITDASATRAGIEDGLDWIEKSTTRDDVAMIYLAGHGVNDPATGNYYFLPTDFEAKRLRSTAVGLADFLEIVSTVAGKVVFFLDTCNSGNVLVGRKGDINRVINELSDAQNGAVVFAASTGAQVALERPDWGNGAFTKALIEGLRGEVLPSGGDRITMEMLARHISDRVKELTGGQQTPVMRSPDGIADFALALR